MKTPPKGRPTPLKCPRHGAKSGRKPADFRSRGLLCPQLEGVPRCAGEFRAWRAKNASQRPLNSPESAPKHAKIMEKSGEFRAWKAESATQRASNTPEMPRHGAKSGRKPVDFRSRGLLRPQPEGTPRRAMKTPKNPANFGPGRPKKASKRPLNSPESAPKHAKIVEKSGEFRA